MMAPQTPRFAVAALLFVSLHAAEARAEDAPDGGLARTSTAALPVPDPGPDWTVESRIFEKAGHLHLQVGGDYLAREDFWMSPGIGIGATYYPWETVGLELAGTLYLSTLEASAERLRREFGVLPDAQQPMARLVVGARWAFAYGKLALEPFPGAVVHFDIGAAVRVGGLVTNRNFNPGGEIALFGEAAFGSWFLLWGEVAGWLSYEERVASELHFGPRGGLGVGARF